jgi:rRNA maturation endonuclease Nob1
MKVAVKDASVFIDMETMGILDLWFLLGYETLTSSLVVGELQDGHHHQSLDYIASDRIRVINTPLEELEALFEELESKGASLADVSVVNIAIENDAMILSGDRVVRLEAKVRKLECRGSIWILDQLVSKGKLQGSIAARKLEELIDQKGHQQRFLPVDAALEYIEKWRKKN